MAASDTSIVVYYWGPTMMNFYGRAIGIYLTLDQAGAKYEMLPAPSAPEGGSFAPPCVVIDGTVMGQTPAILTILGEKYGLAGSTPAEKMQVMQALHDMDDIFSEHGKLAGDTARKDKWMAHLEGKLATSGWMGGTAAPTVADFHGVFAFEWVLKKKIDFSRFENVVKWWTAIRAIPVVAAMYASCVDGRTMIP